MIIRMFYKKNNYLKYISHLNTIDLLQRAIYSTKVKVLFSEGFNPHPKMSFGNPLPLGVSSDFEIFDVETVEQIDLFDFQKKLNFYLPEDIQVFECFEVKDYIGISKLFNYSSYEFTIFTDENLEEIDLKDIDDLSIVRKKKTKSGDKELIMEDIVKHISDLTNFIKVENDHYKLLAKLENSTNKIINPINFIEGIFKKYNLDIDIADVSIHKKEMLK